MARTVKMRKEWQETYELFIAYKKENPDVPIHWKTKYRDFNLGSWVIHQRQFKRKGKLSAERIKRLEEAEITWDPLEVAWQQEYEAFVAYKNDFPDTPVVRAPVARAKYHNINLGQWVGTQRQAYHKKSLSPERIKLLEEADMVWADHKKSSSIDMFERGENVFNTDFYYSRRLPNRIRRHLWQKYNNSCAIGQADLNNFTILPESFLILDGKICGYNGKRPNGNPNLDIAHLDDNFSNNTIENLLPLCPNCHSEITYSAKQTKEHLRKANVTSRRRRGSKTRQSIPSD